MADLRIRSLGTRWLGVGLAAILSVVTIVLAVTGRLALYINPDSAWFALGMAVIVLVGTVASFALPLGAEADHGHDHGEVHDHSVSDEPGEGQAHDHAGRGVSSRFARSTSGGFARSTSGGDARSTSGGGTRAASGGAGAHGGSLDPHRLSPLGLAATVTGGVAASGIVLLALVLPPASLSAELAMSRDVGAPPLFAGADVVALAATGDTSSFGVGEWAAVFATATNPDAFDGTEVTLTGFVTPGDDGFDLTRLVITHCVIDAQPANVPIAADVDAPDTGQWVTVTGTVRATQDGRLSIAADSVAQIDEPEEPYEY